MSTTLTPSSGPMVMSAPDADGAFARAAFPDLVTAGRPEDQGQRAYGGMRERQHRCVPAKAGIIRCALSFGRIVQDLPSNEPSLRAQRSNPSCRVKKEWI